MQLKYARSLLFVPATSTHLLDKATGRGADALVIDLEDAVPLERKPQARSMAAAAVHQLAGKAIFDSKEAACSSCHMAERRDAALRQAQREEPQRLKVFGERIAELDQRIRGLIPQVAGLQREQQHQVQELAVAELQRQKERLAVYATQARFAVAQLYDRAKLAQDAGGPRAPR